MEENFYITLNENIRFVKGAKKAALYDIAKSKVYQTEGKLRNILEYCEKGISFKNLSSEINSKSENWEKADEIVRFLIRKNILALSKNEKKCQKTIFDESAKTLNFMWLELTSRCNLRCIHCYAEAGDNCKNGFLGFEKWKEILNQGIGLGCRSIQFTGGEPALSADLFKLILHAREIGYKSIEVFTNGTLLKDEDIEFFFKNGIDIAVSLYADNEEIHDRITGVSGSFLKTLSSLKNIIASKVNLRVAVIAVGENQDRIEEIINFARGLGIKKSKIKVDAVRPTGRGRKEEIMPLRYIEKLIMRECFVSSISGEDGIVSNNCWNGEIAITENGSVIPCIFSRELKVGDLNRQSLCDIINSSELRKLWSITLDDVEVCRDCEYRLSCFDCRASAYSTTGNILSKQARCGYDPFKGEWERIRMNGDNCILSDCQGDFIMTGGELKKPKIRKGLLFSEIEDEGIVYDEEKEAIHSLNSVSTFILKLCDGNLTIEEIARKVVNSFDAPEGEIKKDVITTIEKLYNLNLLE